MEPKNYVRVYNECLRMDTGLHKLNWGNIPARNKFFVGRQSFIKFTKTIFEKKYANNKDSCEVVVVCGAQGVGKTQIVTEYIHQNENNYRSVIWISAAKIDTDIVELAAKFDLIRSSNAETIQNVKRWLSHRQPCLIVLDEAEEFEQVEAYVPISGCHILITSRFSDRFSKQVDKCIDLNLFTEEESKLCVEKMLAPFASTCPKDVDSLVTLLGNYPLALSQACAYIRECKQTVADYTEKFQSLQKTSTGLNGKLVCIAVRITKSKIKEISVDAEKLLEVCAFLQCDSISKHLLLEALPKFVGHSVDFLSTIRILLSFDLLKNNEDLEEFSMHCILQEAVQFQIEVKEKKRLLEHIIKVVLSCCTSSRMQADLIKKQRMIPHLKKLVNDVKEWNDHHEDSEIQSEILVQLLEAVADLHHELGLYGPDHPEVAQTMTNLGITYGALGDSAKRINYLKRALSIKKKHFGLDHIEIATTMESLGNAYGFSGDRKKQVELLEKSKQILEQHLGSKHVDVGRTMVNLSNAYGELGKTKKQCELLEKALVIQEEYFGPNHPEVAIVLSNLGNVYGYLGDPKRQKELVERALIIQERVFGPEHPQIAKTLDSLGAAYGALGDAGMEKMLLERAYVIMVTQFGSNHPEIARTLVNLSNAYGSLGDHTKRKELLEKALLIQKGFWGLEHPDVAKTMGNLGIAYGALGDSGKQKEMLERALNIQTIHFGHGHPKVAATMANLSSAYVSLGDTKKAKDLLESALSVYTGHFGEIHPDIAVMLQKLATVVGLMGDNEKKIELLQHALKINTTVFGPDHPNTLATMTNLSESKSVCSIS